MGAKDIKTYGFGVVAKGLYNYLETNNELERLKTIIIKNPNKKRELVKTIIETTNEKTLKDKNMDVIVELISSSEEAYGIVAENLEIGKKVISANKKLIAENLEKLISLEQNNKATFLYEGAVCGSIPIIRILNDLYANDNLKEIKGIFNGSSNYILTQLFNNNITYQEALEQAQILGFAEADPTSDVGGYDALYKLIIITAQAFGKIIKPWEVLNIGIENISASDIDFAKKKGLKIKLIAKASLLNNKLSLSVLPTFVSNTADLFNVEHEYNAVLINSENIGEQFYKGKGAGSLPTGSVVYSDLKAIDRGYRYSYKKLKENKNLVLSNNEKISVILSVKDTNSLESLDVEINNFYPIDVDGKKFVAQISINELKKNKPTFQKQGVSIVAIDDEKLVNELIDSSLKEEVLI